MNGAVLRRSARVFGIALLMIVAFFGVVYIGCWINGEFEEAKLTHIPTLPAGARNLQRVGDWWYTFDYCGAKILMHDIQGRPDARALVRLNKEEAQ